MKKRTNIFMQGKIAFESIFDESLRKRAENFLDSGRPVASLTKGLLIAGVIGGTFIVGAAAPNLFKILGVNHRRRNQRLNCEGFRKLQRSFYELRKQKLIAPLPGKTGLEWHYTEKGETEVRNLLSRGWSFPLPPKWDKKCRLILFDIPTQKKVARDALRRELKAMGCYQFQKSVWIYPFPCSREILETSTLFGVKQHIKVCTVEDFSNPRVLSFFQPLLSKYI